MTATDLNTKMQREAAAKKAKSIVKMLSAEEVTIASLTAAIMELREMYKEMGDPMLTKVCRLAAEHIEANGNFEVDILEERSEEDGSSLEYFLNLFIDPFNKYNREEIEEYKLLLLA